MAQADLPHHLIAIGGSAGAFTALKGVLARLPGDLPAAVLIVIHQSQSGSGRLHRLLDQMGPLRAKSAEDGERIESGKIYVAPPDRHLLVEPGRLRLSLGPRENLFRPAIDPLFRTAARAYRARVIGVILSGLLDDGTLGLMRIKQFGGIAVAQDPLDAICPDMPASALRNVAVDHVVTAAEMADVLVSLVHGSKPASAATQPEGAAAMADQTNQDAAGGVASDGADIADHGDNALTTGNVPGTPSGFTCPQCGGAIWEHTDGQMLHYSCHVGHRYTADSMAAEHQFELESTLWAALRMFQEDAALNQRMARRASETGLTHLAARHRERAQDSEARTEIVRRLLLSEPAKNAV